jgi:hypothetical protein
MLYICYLHSTSVAHFGVYIKTNALTAPATSYLVYPVKLPDKVQPKTELFINNHPDEIDRFFSQYPTLAYRREQPAYVVFYRMCDAFGWHKQSYGKYPQEQKDAQCGLCIVIADSLNPTFGPDVDNLESWRRICHCLRLSPMPITVGQTQKVRVQFC